MRSSAISTSSTADLHRAARDVDRVILLRAWPGERAGGVALAAAEAWTDRGPLRRTRIRRLAVGGDASSSGGHPVAVGWTLDGRRQPMAGPARWGPRATGRAPAGRPGRAAAAPASG